MKFGIVSLGCAKNLVDSEEIIGLMKQNQGVLVQDPQDADVIIVNTCGFIESSKQESIDTILEMASYHKILIVTGCLVERYKEDLEKLIPEVDLFISLKEYSYFSTLISQVIKAKYDGSLSPLVRELATPFYSAYLKISEGCNNCCTYCAIPLIRGGFRSFPLEELINEAKVLEQKGIKELVVISQDTTRYGSDLNDGTTTVTLLKELLKIESFDYIRLLYLYPDELSDELIELIGQEKRLTAYFDLPIQHASSKILAAMHRRGDQAFLNQLIEKIRNKVPNAILRTTLIVGFPGETEEDFNELLDFVKKVEFDHLGVFTYSKEEGTESYYYPNQVKESVKKKRLRTIMSEQKKISKKKNLLRIGQIHEGLVTSYNFEKNQYTLRSHFNAPDDIDGNIYFTSKQNLENGSKVKVKILSADSYDLYGELIEE